MEKDYPVKMNYGCFLQIGTCKIDEQYEDIA